MLKGAGLVKDRKAGTRRRVYCVELRGIAELRRYLDRLWDDALRAFKAEAEKGVEPGGRVSTASSRISSRCASP